jgi:hypothetical protein
MFQVALRGTWAARLWVAPPPERNGYVFPATRSSCELCRCGYTPFAHRTTCPTWHTAYHPAQELQTENALSDAELATLATNACDSANSAYDKHLGNRNQPPSTMTVESIVEELLSLFPSLKWNRSRRWEKPIKLLAFGLNRERGTQKDERYILPSRDTTASDVNMRVYELLLKLLERERERHPKFRCTTVQLMENCPERKHEDKNNAGFSLIATFGDFTGGDFKYTQENGDFVRKDVRFVQNDYRMTAFDGCKSHMALATKSGKRYSVTAYYNPKCDLRCWNGPLPPPADELIRMAQEEVDNLQTRQKVQLQVIALPDASTLP